MRPSPLHFLGRRHGCPAFGHVDVRHARGSAMKSKGTIRLYRPDPALAGATQRCGRATFSARRLAPNRTAVAVLGEIDAVNARPLARFVENSTGISRQLVLDLRAVDFFG